MNRHILTISVTILCLTGSLFAKNEPRIGQRVADFHLNNYRGNPVSLSDYKDAKVVVIAVLGTECPLATLYGSRLQQLDEQFGDDVAFIGLNANVQDSVTEIAAYARHHKITFPILKDLGNKIVDQLGAVRTPEMFVLDSRRRIQYQGRIDDQYSPGVIRDRVRHKYLADAVHALLTGKPPRNAYVEPVGCHIGRVRTPVADSEVTFSNQISRLLQKRCVQCHREGEIAPFALIEYDEVVGWAEMIAEVVDENRMPPWHATQEHLKFSNDRTMTAEEKDLIFRWVANGAPEGDPQMLPPPKLFPVSDWSLPKRPDAQFNIQQTPYRVQAAGEVKYQWFSVDPKFTQDKWVQAVEILPGNRAVVHHILAFVQKQGEQRTAAARGYLAGYVPGLVSGSFPAAMAKRIPAGSRLIFQVHYTPVGSIQLDQSKIGFVFIDEEDVQQEIITTSAANGRFVIPAGNSNYKVEAVSATAPVPVTLVGMNPHMHLRGKAFQYRLQLPNGQNQTLLDIPAYDFNWQTQYRLATPLQIPAGARIHCTAYFDNSEQNLNNPDPTSDVRWGDQTWEEMMIGYYDIAVSKGAKPTGNQPAANQNSSQQLIRRLDKNGDGVLKLEEVSEKYKPLFLRLDRNRDGKITATELMALNPQQR